MGNGHATAMIRDGSLVAGDTSNPVHGYSGVLWTESADHGDSTDPEQYLDEVLRVLPHWPRERYLELAPNNGAATRAKLDPEELDAPLCSFTIPPA
jgi:hypothetical protein